MGLGVLNLTPFSLYNLSFSEFNNMIDGYFENKKSQYIEQWERIRWQTAILVNFSGNVKRKIKPTDLITFEWDKVKTEDVTKLKSPEIIQYLDELFPKTLN